MKKALLKQQGLSIELSSGKTKHNSRQILLLFVSEKALPLRHENRKHRFRDEAGDPSAHGGCHRCQFPHPLPGSGRGHGDYGVCQLRRPGAGREQDHCQDAHAGGRVSRSRANLRQPSRCHGGRRQDGRQSRRTGWWSRGRYRGYQFRLPCLQDCRQGRRQRHDERTR